MHALLRSAFFRHSPRPGKLLSVEVCNYGSEGGRGGGYLTASVRLAVKKHGKLEASGHDESAVGVEDLLWYQIQRFSSPIRLRGG